MDLLTAWSNWTPKRRPYVLEEDRTVLNSRKSQAGIAPSFTWGTVIRDSEFGAPGDSKLHLGLIPQPFMGNLRRAKIYILLLNPGLGPHDYFGESKVSSYRNALLRNLKQDHPKGTYPFIFLDPQFSWHGGYQWWHGKLGGVIKRISEAKALPYSKARRRLSADIASIELVPYHSSSFRDYGKWQRELKSVQLARDFVKKFVVKRVQSGRAIAIITRKANVWDLDSRSGVIVYSSGEARAAHMTPSSKGGRAILEWYGIDL